MDGDWYRRPLGYGPTQPGSSGSTEITPSAERPHDFLQMPPGARLRRGGWWTTTGLTLLRCAPTAIRFLVMGKKEGGGNRFIGPGRVSTEEVEAMRFPQRVRHEACAWLHGKLDGRLKG